MAICGRGRVAGIDRPRAAKSTATACRFTTKTAAVLPHGPILKMTITDTSNSAESITRVLPGATVLMVCNVWVWDNGNGDSARWRGTLGEGLKIEAVGDYNGDGKEDLLLREHLSGWGGLSYWGAVTPAAGAILTHIMSPISTASSPSSCKPCRTIKNASSRINAKRLLGPVYCSVLFPARFSEHLRKLLEGTNFC